MRQPSATLASKAYRAKNSDTICTTAASNFFHFRRLCARPAVQPAARQLIGVSWRSRRGGRVPHHSRGTNCLAFQVRISSIVAFFRDALNSHLSCCTNNFRIVFRISVREGAEFSIFNFPFVRAFLSQKTLAVPSSASSGQ